MNDSTKIISSIRALSDGQQPNSDISKILYEHGCFYLLSKIKDQNEYTRKMQADLTLNRICIKERYMACKPIFQMLEQNNISYSVIKGAVLSQTAYGDMNIRKSGDIDLLICRNNIDAVKKIMLQNEFVQGRITDAGLIPFTRQELIFQTGLSHQAAPFIKESRNPLCPYINVDINMDIMWGESKLQPDMDFVLFHMENTEIYGIKAKKSSPVMEFIALCLHHYKDMNSIYLLAEGSLKLSLFCDIYFYLKNNCLNVDKLKEICTKLNVTEYIYYCIFYTNIIFADDTLEVYLITLKNETSDKLLSTFGLDVQESKEWSIPFEDRLFNECFKDDFMKLLSEKDKRKIRLNTLLF